MSEIPPTPDSPTTPQTAPENPSRKGCVIAGSVLFVIVSGFVGFVLWAGLERAHGQTRMMRSRDARAIKQMYESVRAYYNVTGNLPAMQPMENFAEYKWQSDLLTGTRLFTVDVRDNHVSGGNATASYDFSILPTDVFGSLPVAYYTDGRACIVFIPGPDGDFDIKDPAKLFSSATGLRKVELSKLANEKNERGDGDLVRVFIPSESTARTPQE